MHVYIRNSQIIFEFQKKGHETNEQSCRNKCVLYDLYGIVVPILLHLRTLWQWYCDKSMGWLRVHKKTTVPNTIVQDP